MGILGTIRQYSVNAEKLRCAVGLTSKYGRVRIKPEPMEKRDLLVSLVERCSIDLINDSVDNLMVVVQIVGKFGMTTSLY